MAVPLLRHLVRFSSIPKLRSLYTYMFEPHKDYFCTQFLGRGQFAEVLKGAFFLPRLCAPRWQELTGCRCCSLSQTKWPSSGVEKDEVCDGE